MNRLLGAGVFAGSLLMVILLIDGATRPGYSSIRHGVSQLGLGDRGWLAQIAFIVSGTLFAAFAVGLYRLVRTGQFGTSWLVAWFAALAAGLIIAGIVPTDPALGYPPGAPTPTKISLSAGIHQIGGTLVFAGLVGAPISASRWLTRHTRPTWALYARITAITVATTALAAGVTYRLLQRAVLTTGPAGLLELLSFGVGFAWTTLLALTLIRPSPAASPDQRFRR